MSLQALIFDFDGTLTSLDLLDYLADIVQQGAASRHIRMAFQAGTLDGTAALIQRVGLLHGLTPADLQPFLHLDLLRAGHHTLHNWLARVGIPIIIASGNLCPVVAAYADYLSASVLFCTQPTLNHDGQITGVEPDGIHKRVPKVMDYLARHQIDPTNVVVVGDDFSDIPFFQACGWSIAFNPTHPAVSAAASLSLNGTLDDLIETITDL